VLAVRLRDNSDSSLSSPSQQDLSGSLIVVLSDLGNNLMFEKGGKTLCPLKVQLNKALRSERRVGGNSNILALSQVEKVRLNKVGVVLDLKNSRLDASRTEKVQDQRSLEVGNSDGTDQTGVNALLESGPGGVDRGGDGLDGAVGVVPSGGVGDGGVDVGKGDGEVDVEEVEVPGWELATNALWRRRENLLKTPPLKLLADNGLNFVGLMESVPEL
jgi:hypothetical protein